MLRFDYITKVALADDVLALGQVEKTHIRGRRVGG
jgi:hypothetical protein